MAWMMQPIPSQQALAEEFRRLIAGPHILKLPGAHDALAGMMAKDVGFQALYLSGAAYTGSRGLPDLGMVSAEEVAHRAADIIRATGLPLLVDIDTGFGGVINVARTARIMAEAGVAAVQIEDQELPKKCGHLNGKQLITAEEMTHKIRMIRRTAPDLVIVARTDAAGVEGLEAAVERARLYAGAGADAIFPEALTNAEAFQAVAGAVPAPLLANMTEFGRTPYYTAQQFEDWGYRLVIFPVSSLRMAAHAYARLYRTLLETGTQEGLLQDMQTRQELYRVLGYADYEALDEGLAKSGLPKIGE